MEEQKKKHSNKLPITVILVIAALVVLVMTLSQMKTQKSNGCVPVQQSAFGQGPSQTWVEMKSQHQADIGAGFTLTYPEDAVNTEYDSVKYFSYSQQIDEARWYQGDQEVFRVSKGKMCGKALYAPDGTFASTFIADVNGMKVTEYGDGQTVTAAAWTDGAYSYFLGAFAEPMEKDRIEGLVTQIK